MQPTAAPGPSAGPAAFSGGLPVPEGRAESEAGIGTEAATLPDAAGPEESTDPAVPVEDLAPGTRAHLEIERTFEVPRNWTLPRLAGVGGVTQVEPPRRFTQTATYWDTPRLSLLQARHTLRRRTGGTDAGWHLKTPRAGQARVELTQPLGTSAHVIPLDLRAVVADLVAGQPLVPVAVLRTRRSERRLLDGTGRPVALLADDTVEATVLRHGERIYRWREVEVELAEPGGDTLPRDAGHDGDAAVDHGAAPDGGVLLTALSEALLASGLSVSAHQSKLRRALSEELTRLAAPSRTDAGEVLLAYLGAQLGALQSLEAAVRADRPDAVHKARVATRRLRSCLHTFRPLFERAATDPIRTRVAWLTGVLGAPRDAEVIRDHFAAVLDALEPELLVPPAPDRLLATLGAEHEQAHAALVAALDSARYGRLLGDLIDLVVNPPWRAGVAPSDLAAVQESLSRVGKRVASAAAVAQSAADAAVRDEAIHEVRKRAKAARYAAEAAGDAVGGAAKRLATAWTQVQEALGEYQDSVVARQVVERVCAQARAAGEDTFSYGVLAERETERARRIRLAYPALLTAARKAARALERDGGPPPPSSRNGRRKGRGGRSAKRGG